MSDYLQQLGLGKTSYDRFPFVEVEGFDDQCWRGWEAICSQLKQAVAERRGSRTVLAIECYSGVQDDELIPALQSGLEANTFHVTTREIFQSASEIDALVAGDLGGEDPIFGRLTRLTMEDFLDPKKRSECHAKIQKTEGLTVIYGPGALLCGEPDIIVFADMARWEAQLRQRRNEINNLGVENRQVKASLQYKRSFFVDWRVCDKLKRATMASWDFLLDTTQPGAPKMITGAALRDGLAQAATRPFRVVPFFDPGPWGGQWMQEVCGLPEGPPNYAWCFDCVPEENSLLLDYGGIRIEIPSINLVFRHSEELLGEAVYGRFGAEFPIRFDILDTMGGGNLSFQVHPSVDFAREHFDLPYTQDESYYLLDAEPGAVVYLGCKDGTDPDAMFADLEAARLGGNAFDDVRFAARFEAEKHDHFLIPSGTLHCSGSGSMVLEISATPYIFTFKLWDWNRMGLDGLPRPVNLERGRAVIRWDRDQSYARKHLVNRFEGIACGNGWREERTGLHPAEFIETRRHWFTALVPHHTGGGVNVLNLVQGAEAVIESPSNAFAPFIVHYAETFIIPAAVGPYTIRPSGDAIGTECATLKAFVRNQAH